MSLKDYLLAALIAICLGEAALLRHWVKFRRRECAQCLVDMRAKYSRAGPERRSEPKAEQEPSIMTAPITRRIQ